MSRHRYLAFLAKWIKGQSRPPPSGGVSGTGHQPKMMFPLVRDLAFEGIPVSLSCRVLGFSRQGYYTWRADPVCERDSAFGYRLITDELKDAHVVMGENRVHRLCRENRL